MKKTPDKTKEETTKDNTKANKDVNPQTSKAPTKDKSDNACECPEKVSWCPADQLGISKKCCFCVPIKHAAIIICIISFIWSVVELKKADGHVADIFPDRTDSIAYQILFYPYFVLCIGFVLATSVLLVGVLRTKYILVNIFVWYAFFFNILSICVTLASALSAKLRLGSIPRGIVCKSAFAVIWACLFCHFIVVINTYKHTHTTTMTSNYS